MPIATKPIFGQPLFQFGLTNVIRTAAELMTPEFLQTKPARWATLSLATVMATTVIIIANGDAWLGAIMAFGLGFVIAADHADLFQ